LELYFVSIPLQPHCFLERTNCATGGVAAQQDDGVSIPTRGTDRVIHFMCAVKFKAGTSDGSLESYSDLSAAPHDQIPHRYSTNALKLRHEISVLPEADLLNL
jgi:hypothetical protein